MKVVSNRKLEDLKCYIMHAGDISLQVSYNTGRDTYSKVNERYEMLKCLKHVDNAIASFGIYTGDTHDKELHQKFNVWAARVVENLDGLTFLDVYVSGVGWCVFSKYYVGAEDLLRNLRKDMIDWIT